jgi:hypothetical protein
MSSFPSRVMLMTSALGLSGCMHQPPMYQQGPYGAPAYGNPGYMQPGTLVVPPAGNQYQLAPGSTYDSNGTGTDDFKKDDGTTDDGRFFRNEEKVPEPKEPGTFTDDLAVPSGT